MKIGKAGVALIMLLAAGRAGADSSCSLSRDDNDYGLRPPRLLQPVQSFSTVLAPNAIVATETQIVDLDLFRTDRAVTISSPITLHLDAGQAFGHRWIEGVVRLCIDHGLTPFEPPEDEEGRSFPTICLEDHDADGRYETIRLFAYRAAPGHGILDGRIDPVRLEPLRDRPSPDSDRYLLYRRLRVVSVTQDRARFISDFAVVGRGEAASDIDYRPASTSEIEVALHEGDVEVSGLKLHLLHVGGSWTATPKGAFSTWAGLYCYDSRIWLFRAPGTVTAKKNPSESK